MSSNKVLFNSPVGFADANISYLSGAGAPGGDTSYQDAAPRGSHFQETVTGYSYIKSTAGAGTDKWQKLATSDDLNSLVTGISWREPVAITDFSYTSKDAAKAALEGTGALQGYTVLNGDRLLLANGTFEPNVYIATVTGTGTVPDPFVWTLTEDTNIESLGDTVQTLYGDNANRVYSYEKVGSNSPAWIWTGSQSNSEDAFVRTFIGKSAVGNVTPTYATNHYVTTTHSLEASIGDLDAALYSVDGRVGTLETASTATQNELNRTITSLGGMVTQTAGATSATWIGFTGTHYLNDPVTPFASVTSATAAFIALDSQLYTTQSNLDTFITGSGLTTTTGGYTADSSTNYLKAAAFTAASLTPSLKSADKLLDAVLKTSNDNIGHLVSSLGANVDATGALQAVTNTNVTVVDTNTVWANLSALDAAVALLGSGSTTSIDNIIGAVGLNTNGTYKAITGSTYISGVGVTSIVEALKALDVQAKVSTDEEGYIRTFIGKSAAGSITPTYTKVGRTTVYTVVDTESLEESIGKLDAGLHTTNGNLNTFITGAGLTATTGAYANNAGTNYIKAADLAAYNTLNTTTLVASLNTADILLDAALKTEADRASGEEGFIRSFIGKGAAGTETPSYSSYYNITAQTSDLETAISNLDGAIGSRAYTSTNVVVSGTTVAAAISALDASLASSVAPSSVDTVTTITTIDSVKVDDVSSAKWLYTISNVAGTKKQTGEINAIHDGHGSSDATFASFNEFGQIRVGDAITGLVIGVDVTGTGGTQTMIFTVTSTETVNVRATRVRVAI